MIPLDTILNMLDLFFKKVRYLGTKLNEFEIPFATLTQFNEYFWDLFLNVAGPWHPDT